MASFDPFPYDIVVHQGATFELPFAVQNSDKTSFNFTNFSGRMNVRRTAEDTEVLLAVPVSGATITLALGQVTLALSSAVTEALERGDFVYDLEVYDSAIPPVVHSLLKGKFTVARGVTRP